MKGIFSERFFRKIGLLTVASILFLVFVGGLVRITGSGMGCPDWPKCFGYYIPPTDIEQLTFAPGKSFKKGQMIIRDEKLWVAKGDFIASQNFSPADWTVYTKHSYAKFNPTHTYIEWLNRMVSVFVGIFMVLMVISSFQYRKTRVAITVLSIASFLLTLFQAWLGAKVVESNLEGYRISIHMLVAFGIVGLAMLAVYYNRAAEGLERLKSLTLLKGLVYGLIVLTLLQIFLGTQVREQIDEWGLKGWPEFFNEVLDPHKTLAAVILILTLAVTAILRRSVNRRNELYKFAIASVVLALLQIATGTANVFYTLPPVAQLLHVTLSGLLMASLFYKAILLYNYKKEAVLKVELNDN